VYQFSDCQCSRRNFNFFHNIGDAIIFSIAHPFPISEKIPIFFTIRQILIQVSIKARRAILTTGRVVFRTILTHRKFRFPASIRPARRHITTINQFGGKFPAIIVGLQDATQPRFISIPMMINRKNTAVREFNSDASTSSDEWFLKSTNVL
jgi:hypothetical protein